jgi:MFS family permease
MVSSWPFGIALALVTQNAMADALSWQAVMFLTSAISAVGLAGISLLVGVQETAPESEVRAPLFSLTRLELLLASLAGLAWAIYNVGFVMFVSFGPDVLATEGYSDVDAAALVSIGVWATMLSIPLGGYLGEKFGRPQATIMIFAALLAITIGVFPYLAIPALLSLLFGVMVGPPTRPLVALPSDALSEKNRGPGLGVFYIWYYVAMAVGPAVAGAARNTTGSTSTPLLIGAGLFA